MHLRRTGRFAALASVVATSAALLVGCATAPVPDSPIRLGWLGGGIPPLDPAASESVAAFAILDQVHPSLLTIEAEEPAPVLDLAESAAFTADNEYTVTIPRGVEFANGNDLTSSDVVFSIERQLDLQEDETAVDEFADLEAVEAVDDTTIVFRLRDRVDVGFPFILAGPGGLIVDEESFFADAITPDEEIIAAQAFGGAYLVERSRTDVVSLVPFDDHVGLRSARATIEFAVGEPDELAAQLQDGGIDLITGRLPLDVAEELRDDHALELTRASSGRLRMLAFDLEHMPFGIRSEVADPAKALALRQAAADLVDRAELVDQLGSTRVSALAGYLPTGSLGVANPFDALRGDGEGGPDPERAAATLAAAGVETPVELTIHLLPDWEDGVAQIEAEVLEAQLEMDDVFDVTIVETDAEGLDEARIEGDVQAVLTSVLPSNCDPGAYLAMFGTGGAFNPGFSDSTVDSLLARQLGETDPAVRAATLTELQNAVAAAVPAIPLTQNERVVFARSGVQGIALNAGVILDLTTIRR